MNANPDPTDTPPLADETTGADTPVARPARRPRTPKSADADAAAVQADTTGDAPPREPPRDAPDAPRPRRRRVAAAAAEVIDAPAPPMADAAENAPHPAAAALPSADLPMVVGVAGAAGSTPAGDVSVQAEVGAPQGQEGSADSEESGDGPGEGAEGPRSRRRNRRDRKRGRGERGPDGERGDSSAAAEGAPAELPPEVPARASELFSQVVSGAYDSETGVAEEAEVSKRVLAPEPEAPKLHKVLAQSGIGSRRDMEALIVDGHVTVNGEPAHVGQRVSFGDQVKIDGKPVRLRILPGPARIVAYHKPVGEIVTHDDPEGRPTVFRNLPRLAQGKWQSVGRLDINTEGLLLFTNSGELANQLMHPRFGVEREYAVRVLGTLSPEDRARLLEGVEIDAQPAAFRSIEDGGGEGANHWYRVVIAEGRNREVRKLFDAVGLTVSRLIRIRYGNVVLPLGLKRGDWVDLPDGDVRTIRRLASGSRDGGGGPARGNERGNERGNKQRQRNDRQGPCGNDRGRGEGRPRSGEGAAPAPAPVGHDDDDFDIDFDPRSIPNPLEQTFDKRFVQNPRGPAGGRGFSRGYGGFGAGGSAPAPAPAAGGKKGGGASQPDPLQTSTGYLGADAYHRKNRGGRGGNRGRKGR